MGSRQEAEDAGNVPGTWAHRSQLGAEIREKPDCRVVSLLLALSLVSWSLLGPWDHVSPGAMRVG